MRFALWVVLGAMTAAGQSVDSIARQRAAIEQQRAAVRQQVRSAAQPAAAFFTVPWVDPAPRPVVAPAAECEPVPEEEIGPLVHEISQREGLTPDLLRAVIEKESSYLPCAVSPAGAEGLMQLMPQTAAALGVEDPFDPRQSLDGGARYLKQMLDRYGGNLMMALAAYNAGPGRADHAGVFPLPAETSNYVSDILLKLGQPAESK